MNLFIDLSNSVSILATIKHPTDKWWELQTSFFDKAVLIG